MFQIGKTSMNIFEIYNNISLFNIYIFQIIYALPIFIVNLCTYRNYQSSRPVKEFLTKQKCFLLKMHARYVCDMSSVQVWFCIRVIIFAHVCKWMWMWVRVCACVHTCVLEMCDIFTIPHVCVSLLFSGSSSQTAFFFLLFLIFVFVLLKC